MTTERKLTIQAASVLAVVVTVVAGFMLLHNAALTRFTEFEARQDGQRVLRDMQWLEKIEPCGPGPIVKLCGDGSDGFVPPVYQNYGAK